MPPLPDVLPDDPAALKAIILAQREEVARAKASALLKRAAREYRHAGKSGDAASALRRASSVTSEI